MTRPATSQTYPYQPTGSLRPAGLLLVIAAMLTVLLPEADLRLLAALFALPPLLWLALAWRRARTSLTLTSNALVIRHPFG
ncbi:MAG: hypothetical protein JW910_13970, partial [Anaerolineae bacterium]|nr:hypothetical protein [Anaerolineae bacterium]